MINIEDIVTEKYLDNKLDDRHFLKYANEHRKKMDKTVKQLGMSKYVRNRKY